MSNKSILVTGGAGYLGSILSRELSFAARQFEKVYIVDKGLYGFNGLDQFENFLQQDIKEVDISQFENVEWIIHLADINPSGCFDHLSDADYLRVKENIKVIAQIAKKNQSKVILISDYRVLSFKMNGEVGDKHSELRDMKKNI